MKKKITGILVVLTLVILTTFGSVVPAERLDFTHGIPEKCIEYIGSDENETNVFTLGPISPLFNITKITLIDGNPKEIQKIERILNNRILQLILPLTIIKCHALNFSVTYNKDVPFFIPLIRHISYFTTLFVDFDFPFNKETIWGKRHTVTVKGFEGIFEFQRLRPWKIAPALFAFAGSYKEVTIIR